MRNLIWTLSLALTSLCWGTSYAQRQRSATEWDNDSTYHFTERGTYLHHKRSAGRVVEEKPIAGSWGCVTGPIDAAVGFGNRKVFLFFGSRYARYDMDRNACDAGYPKPIAGGWPGLPWTADIDAAVAYNGKAYFFKGAEYLRYDIATDRADPGYPKPISVGWPGVPFSSIDSAVNTSDGKVVLFKGEQAISYDIARERADGAPFASRTYFGASSTPNIAAAPSAPATPLAPAAQSSQCTTRGGCICKSDLRDYEKPILNGQLISITVPFKFRNWHFLRDQCDPTKKPGTEGYIGYPGDGKHKPGTPFASMRDVVAFVVHETGGPRGFKNDGGNLPTFFIDDDSVVYQLRDLGTWQNGAGSTYVDQRSLSVEIANGTYVVRKPYPAFTNAYYPDSGEACPKKKTCIDMRGGSVQVPVIPAAPLPPFPFQATIPSKLIPSILLELPSDQQLETLYKLAQLVIEGLHPALQHRIDWEFPAATVNVGNRLLPENYFILSGGGTNFFRDNVISCASKSHLQRAFLDCGHNGADPGGILSHSTVNGEQKSTDGLAPHLYLYLAKKRGAVYNTHAKVLAAMKCILEHEVVDLRFDTRLRRFFDTDSLSIPLCPKECWLLPWLARLDSPLCRAAQ